MISLIIAAIILTTITANGQFTDPAIFEDEVTMEKSLEVNNDVTAGSFTLDGDTITKWPSGGKFKNGTDPANAVYTEGNVGIGTPTPEAKLHVKNNSGGADVLIQDSWVAGLRLERRSTFHNDLFADFYTTTPNGKEQLRIETSSGDIELQANNNAGQLFLAEKGNVGIGTTTPQATLDVRSPGSVGGGTILKLYDPYGPCHLTVEGGVGDHDGLPHSWGFTFNVHDGVNHLGHMMKNSLHFRNANTPGAGLFIKNDNNVGIGTITPEAKLHVDGNAIADDPIDDNHLVTKRYLKKALQGEFSMPKGLALYYNFDEDEGNTVTDQSGNGHTGNINGALHTTEGKYGGGMVFDGDDWVEAGDIFDLGNEFNSITVCAWVKTSFPDMQASSIVTKSQVDHPYTGWRLSAQYNQTNPTVFSDIIGVWPSEQIYNHTSVSIADDEWHFVCGTFAIGSASMQQQVYVDGVLAGSKESPGIYSTTDTSAPFTIGNRDLAKQVNRNWWGFSGVLDEIQVYGRILTADEISSLYGRTGNGLGDNLGNHIAEQELDMVGKKVINLGDPVDGKDAVNLERLQAEIQQNAVSLTGDTMQGTLDMGEDHQIKNLSAPTDPQDAVNLITLETKINEARKFVDGTESAEAVYMEGNVGIGIENPTEKLEVYGGKIWAHQYVERGEKAENLLLGGFGNTPFAKFSTKYDMLTSELDIQGYGWKTETLFSRGSNEGRYQKILELGGQNETGHYLKLYDGTSENVNLELRSDGDSFINGGNLGIGVTIPKAKLHVSGDATVTGVLRIWPAGDLEMGEFDAGTKPPQS